MKWLLRTGAIALLLGALAPASAMAGVTPTGTPTISGTAKVGGTLTCNASGVSWQSNDSGTATTVDYDWYQGSTSGTQVWDSANQGTSPTDDTYEPQVSDIGTKLVCTETDEDEGNGDFTSSTTNGSPQSTTIQAGAPPVNTALPTLSGSPEVGQLLTCNAGTWNPGVAGDDTQPTDYSWYNGGTLVFDSGNGDDDTYTPTSANIGQKLVCKETEEDVETGGTATAASTPATPAVTPEASVTLTNYSAALAGNIGENVAGVSVTASLERREGNGTTVTVATATGTTNASGAWNGTLSPTHGFGDNDDVLSVAYAVGTAPGSTTVPANTSYGFGDLPEAVVDFVGGSSQITPDGMTIELGGGFDCSALKYAVDGTSHPTTSTTDAEGNPECVYSPATAVTDNNHVQASYTSEKEDPNGVLSTVTAIDDVGLPGAGEGAPTCAAELVFGSVTCTDLNSGSFTVSRNGGTAVALTTSPTGNSAAGGEPGDYDEGTATIAGLTAGDTLVLKQSGGSRAISTLHLGTLRIDVGSDGAIDGGSCKAGELLTASELFDSAGGVCPSSGTIGGSTGSGGDAEEDDLSGGSTKVDVPTLANLMPAVEDSMPGGVWTSYGDVNGDGNTAQTQAAVASVLFQVVPHAGGAPAVSGNMTPGSDSVGPFESYTLASALAAGRYFADWKLTDSHGDTVAYQNLFAQQAASATQGPAGTPGKDGSQGAQGRQGAQGPQGPAGKSSLVKCTVTTTGKGKKKKKHETCKVSVLAAGTTTVSVDISRGKRVYAVASGAVRRGVARLRFRNLRAVTRGRYLITVVATVHGKATVSRFYERL